MSENKSHKIIQCGSCGHKEIVGPSVDVNSSFQSFEQLRSYNVPINEAKIAVERKTGWSPVCEACEQVLINEQAQIQQAMANTDDIPEPAKEIIEVRDYNSLTETQKTAFLQDILSEGSHLLVAETGNGKTLCAETKIKRTVNSGGRVAYLVPSRQLKTAKHDEVTEWADFEVMVAGKDNDAYRDGDVVVATFEGFYRMLLRHEAKVSNLSLVVLDDFHYLYDSYRGFNLEKVIAGLKKNDIDILAMSASIGEPESLADWMDANLIVSDESRRVPIKEEVVERKGDSTIAETVGEFVDSNHNKAPFLIFNKSKREAEKTAKEIAMKRGWRGDSKSQSLSDFVEDGRSQEEQDIAKIKEELRKKVDGMSMEVQRLAEIMSWGVAYHHASLPKELRNYIEDAYQKERINCLSTTTTLASGYDAPVKTVVVAHYKRWDPEEGATTNVGVWEYEQWIGRAGRPGYHDEGNAVIITKDANDVEHYLAPRELEKIQSHVQEDELLRKFLLELIVTGRNTEPDIRDFINQTLWLYESQKAVFGVQYDPYDSVEETIKWLHEGWFIERTGKGFRSTHLGEAAVEYGFRQFGRYSLTGIRNLYEWLDSKQEIEQLELTKGICDFQDIQLYNSDEHDMSSEFERRLKSNGLEPESDTDITAAILCWYWCENGDLTQATQSSGLRAEFAKSAARDVQEVLPLVNDVIDAIAGLQTPSWLSIFEKQMRHGVSAEEAKLVDDVDGLGRQKVNNLQSYIENVPKELSGGLRSRLRTLINEEGAEEVRQSIEDSSHAAGIGEKISQRIVDSVAYSLDE